LQIYMERSSVMHAATQLQSCSLVVRHGSFHADLRLACASTNAEGLPLAGSFLVSHVSLTLMSKKRHGHSSLHNTLSNTDNTELHICLKRKKKLMINCSSCQGHFVPPLARSQPISAAVKRRRHALKPAMMFSGL